MPKRDVVATVDRLARPLVEGLGLELVDVEWLKEGGHWYLRLYIDKPAGISHDDCEAVSRVVGEELDKADPIPEHYLFEVSSPGIERPLKKDADFARFAGQPVEITTFAPIDGQRRHAGILVGLRDGQVRVRLAQGKEIAIDRAQVAQARLRVEF